MTWSRRILSNGAWTGKIPHNHDQSLVFSIISVLKKLRIRSALDLGCGDGYYTQKLNDNGIACRGYDANPDTAATTGGLCQHLDLSVPIVPPMQEPAVLCLEVAEHVPKQFEAILVANLKQAASRLLILSWAVPGQGGHGHFNERPNDYVASLFTDQFTRDQKRENHLREASSLRWFQNTLMVFERTT